MTTTKGMLWKKLSKFGTIWKETKKKWLMLRAFGAISGDFLKCFILLFMPALSLLRCKQLQRESLSFSNSWDQKFNSCWIKTKSGILNICMFSWGLSNHQNAIKAEKTSLWVSSLKSLKRTTCFCWRIVFRLLLEKICFSWRKFLIKIGKMKVKYKKNMRFLILTLLSFWMRH